MERWIIERIGQEACRNIERVYNTHTGESASKNKKNGNGHKKHSKKVRNPNLRSFAQIVEEAITKKKNPKVN